MLKRWAKKHDCLQVDCPRCGALAGNICEQDPLKVSYHLARHEAAIQAGAPIAKQITVPDRPQPEGEMA